jgi:hypothetical protein
MPEPIAGRQDHRYLYEAVVNFNAFLPKVSVTQTMPNPEPSEPFNVLLHKLAQAVGDSLFLIPPPAPCTDNAYLQYIAQGLAWMLITVPVGQGRPDQVYVRLICQQLYHYNTVVMGWTAAMAPPDPADPENRLWQKLASLTYELATFYP